MNGCFEKIATTSQSLELLGRWVCLALHRPLTLDSNNQLRVKIVIPIWPVMQAFSGGRVSGIRYDGDGARDMNGRGRQASPRFAPSVVRLLLPYLSFNIQ